MKSLKAKFRKSDTHEWSKNDERLMSAVEQGEVDKVAALLAKKGASAVKLSTEGKAALHVAAARGQTECLAAILSHGADASVTDSSGFSALHHAAKNGHLECAKKLIQSKCPVEPVDSSGRTALHHAAICGSAEITQLLCESKCPLELRDMEGFTALQLSARHGHPEACRCLLDWGADINASDRSGRTAVMLASESNSTATLEVLVQRGADLQIVDSLGHNVLHYAKLSSSQDAQALLTGALRKAMSDSDAQLPKCAQHDQVARLSEDRSSTPKKRKAPPPPVSPVQSADVTSPPYFTPIQTPPAGRRFSYKGEELRSADLKEEVEQLKEEKIMLLETIEDLKQFIQQSHPKGHLGPEEHGQVAALQAKVASLSLENQQLASILKKHSSPQGEKRQESSRPNSIDSNTSYHSTHADFDQTASLEEGDSSEASCIYRHGAEGEEARQAVKEGSKEEIRLLTEALQSLQAKLQVSQQENRTLQARLSPTPEDAGERIGPQDTAELQERYQQAMRELEVLRVGHAQEGEAPFQKVQELKAELAQVQEERERDRGLMKEMESRLEAQEQWEDLQRTYNQLVDDSTREKALLMERQKEAQEEIRMLQEALRGTVPVEAAAKDFEEMKAELTEVIDGLQRRLLELSHSYSEARSELSTANSKLEAQQTQKPQLQELEHELEEARGAAAQAEARHQEALKEVGLLRQEVEAQAQGSVALADHTQVVSSMANAIKRLEAQVGSLQEELTQKAEQAAALQERLTAESNANPEDTVPLQEHERLRADLEAKAGRLTQLLHDALRKQDDMALEAASAMQTLKDERQAAQDLAARRLQENMELSKRYAEAHELTTELKKRVEDLQASEAEKNKKVEDLTREVSKLKEALNSLSQLSYASGTPKRQNLQVESLQQQVKQLQYQLAETKKQHREIVSVYRMHLLYAVQGQMDEDVQKALKQILMMCKIPAETK